MAKKRQITEEQRKSLLERLELARAKNPFHNPALREPRQPQDESKQKNEEEEEENSSGGLRPHLTGYLGSPKSVKDFEIFRKKSPEKALEFATERIWGAKSGSGTKQNQGRIGVLIKVLTGNNQNDTPQHIVSDRDIPAEHNDTGKPEITDIIIDNQDVE